MTYYLYKRPDGLPEVLTMPVIDAIFPGYKLIKESEEPIDCYGKAFDAANNLIDRPKPYDEQRREAYPKVSDQLDMLWHAMDDGLIPKIEPMYSDIKAVKEAYPKPSN